MTNTNLSYVFETVEYFYDENTKIRVGVMPNETKLAVAVDIASALGYRSVSSAASLIKDLGLVSYVMPVLFKTRKRGVAKAHLIPIESVRRLLTAKCGSPEFTDWMLNIVMVKGPIKADTSKPYKRAQIKPIKMLEPENAETKECTEKPRGANVPDGDQSLTLAQVDKIIAELLVLRQRIS